MFCLYFTTPARRKPDRARGEAVAGPSGYPALITYALLLAWLVLMGYGVLLQVQPPWLRKLSRPGIRIECRDYKNHGDSLVRQGQHSLAIAQYLKSLAIDPDQIPVTINLAVAYRDAGDNDKAASILTDALARETSPYLRALIHYNLGELREREDDPDAALSHYQEALPCRALHDRVYRKLGLLYIAAQQYAAARKAYEQALRCQRDPGFEYMRMLEESAVVYKDNPTHRTIIERQLMQGVGPQDLEPYDLETIHEAQEHGAGIASICDHLGLLCVYLGDTGAAIRYFEQSLAASPDNQPTRQRLRALQASAAPTP